jgi:hypothetical protein
MKLFLAMAILGMLICAGCVSSGPSSGTLGDPVPPPWGWQDYINRGGR